MARQPRSTQKKASASWREHRLMLDNMYQENMDHIFRDLERRKNLIHQVETLAKSAYINNLPLTGMVLTDAAARMTRILIDDHESVKYNHQQQLDGEIRRYEEELVALRALMKKRVTTKKKPRRTATAAASERKKVLEQAWNDDYASLQARYNSMLDLMGAELPPSPSPTDLLLQELSQLAILQSAPPAGIAEDQQAETS